MPATPDARQVGQLSIQVWVPLPLPSPPQPPYASTSTTVDAGDDDAADSDRAFGTKHSTTPPSSPLFQQTRAGLTKRAIVKRKGSGGRRKKTKVVRTPRIWVKHNRAFTDWLRGSDRGYHGCHSHPVVPAAAEPDGGGPSDFDGGTAAAAAAAADGDEEEQENDDEQYRVEKLLERPVSVLSSVSDKRNSLPRDYCTVPGICSRTLPGCFRPPLLEGVPTHPHQ